MPRRFRAAVCLDQDALSRLKRFRRGTRQTLSRTIAAIVHDFLDTLRSEHRRGRRPRTAHRRQT